MVFQTKLHYMEMRASNYKKHGGILKENSPSEMCSKYMFYDLF